MWKYLLNFYRVSMFNVCLTIVRTKDRSMYGDHRLVYSVQFYCARSLPGDIT